MERSLSVAATMVLLAAGAVSRPAAAQMLGAPVLQDAFSNPGLTFGGTFGSGDGAHTYGVAGAWAPVNGAVQLSGGVALFDPDTGSVNATWGVRIMAPIPKVGTRTLGLAAFVGVGGLSAHHVANTRLPIGVSVGYRHALGATRGIAVYLTPFYSWSRIKHDSVDVHHSLFRVSVGADIAVMPGLGITMGYEGGSRAHAGEPGPAGGLFGVGLSYALRHPK